MTAHSGCTYLGAAANTARSRFSPAHKHKQMLRVKASAVKTLLHCSSLLLFLLLLIILLIIIFFTRPFYLVSRFACYASFTQLHLLQQRIIGISCWGFYTFYTQDSVMLLSHFGYWAILSKLLIGQLVLTTVLRHTSVSQVLPSKKKKIQFH